MPNDNLVHNECFVCQRRPFNFFLAWAAGAFTSVILVAVVFIQWKTVSSFPTEFTKAWELLDSERLDEALKSLNVLMRQPQHGDAYLVLDAYLSVYHRDFEAAEKRIQVANAGGRLRPYALEILGRSHYGQQHWYEAERAFATLAQENPQNFSAHFWLGVVYDEVHMFGQAMHEMRLASEIRPRDPRPPIVLGSILLRRGQYHAAAEQYQNALRLLPTKAKSNVESNHLLVSKLVRCLVEDGQFEAGLEQTEATSDPPPELRVLRAECFLGLGKLTEAERECRAILEQDENQAPAAITLTKVGLQQSVTTEHAQLLESVLATNPKNSDAAYLLSQVYGRLGNLQRQRELLDQSQKLARLHVRIQELMSVVWSQPDDVESRQEMATIFDELGDPVQAMQWRQAATACRFRAEAIKAAGR